MWRSLLAVCLFLLAGAFTVSGVANATPAPQVGHVAAQPSEPVDPGPDVNAPQEDKPGNAAETRKKFWLGGIALVLFAIVYWRNKKRWNKWRKSRKAG